MKYLIFGLFIFIAINLTACSDTNQPEQNFINKANNFIKNSTDSETNLENFIEIPWNKICFTSDFLPIFNIINEEMNSSVKINLSDKRFVIEEDYVKSSPGNKCFNRGTIFILTKSKNMRDNKDDILIRVKG